MAVFEDVFYTSADGRLTLYARDYGGTGSPVLCMHGLTRNSADFESIAAHLSPRYRVIAADMRGRGKSGYDPEPLYYTPAVYSQDMITLLGHLGIGRAALIGTSMGGIMAMIIGVTAPQMVAGMVLNDVGPVIDQAGLDRIASYTGKSPPILSWADAAARARATNAVAFPHYTDDDWMAFARRTYHEGEDGLPVSSYDPAIAIAFAPPPPDAPRPDLWPLWDGLKAIPVLSLRGELSDLLSGATVQAMAARHAGLTSVTVPGVGHAPMLDEAVAVAAIDDFLSKLEA